MQPVTRTEVVPPPASSTIGTDDGQALTEFAARAYWRPSYLRHILAVGDFSVRWHGSRLLPDRVSRSRPPS